MGAKGKYNPERVEIILEAIRKGGRDLDGYHAAGIHRDTFYKWVAEKQDFAKKVAEAREEWRKNSPGALKKAAQNKLADYVINGTVTTVDTVEVIQKKVGDKWVDVERKKRHREFRNPVPQWVFDRVLGKNIPLIEAVQIMLNNGLASPQQAAIVESSIADMERQLRELNERKQVENVLEGQLVEVEN